MQSHVPGMGTRLYSYGYTLWHILHTTFTPSWIFFLLSVAIA